MEGYLVLENGQIFKGSFLGAPGDIEGEVVFSTGLTGYQELFSDPSFAGQIVVMTYPVVGNYGFNYHNFVSPGPKLRGLVIREACEHPSHHLCAWNMEEFVSRFPFPVLTGVDTRALTRVLRSRGTMGGVIVPELDRLPEIVDRARHAPGLLNTDLVGQVSVKEPETHGDPEGRRVVMIDYGSKWGIRDALTSRGCRVTVLPARATAEQVMSYRPDGVFLSNGPGDPKACTYAIKTIRELLGKVPIFGICLGHQLLALALGCDTYKLPFGHRGVNQPVKNTFTGRVYITSQNHGYAVDPNSVPADVDIEFINLNDNTVEGIRHRRLPAASVQFHPEGFPGFTDTGYLFDDFVAAIAS